MITFEPTGDFEVEDDSASDDDGVTGDETDTRVGGEELVQMRQQMDGLENMYQVTMVTDKGPF